MILAVVLQKTFAPLFSIKSITPDLVLIGVMAISLQHGRVWGVLIGFSAGLLFDILGTEFVGLSSLSKSVAAYLAGFFGAERLERRSGGIIGFLFLVLFAHDCMYYSILSIGTPAGFWSTLFKQALPTAIYTLVFMIMIDLVWPKALWRK
ncbi:rod shape-determining protein MreD [candidate division KSB1 bacterium]|nr:rod shape-determining protein MreD [candidate division KSB1 bacterium]NIS26621.1 rod shape-determining protein MreD [candidate division KSB1 bacterium]NIT73389.1 rod shape-determining protein MreD [candidate division KSB1 bacterium]NIU27237.1 rod shape-determining protein MreD [candidate division KSB1 bacterium]NIU93669.1 rod shape-determining protein MreD [candidate division KSB1 bacterium]